MNAFFRTPAVPGYGARIWLLRDERQDIKTELNHLSRWGGVDKTDGNWMAWEFGAEQFTQAIDFLVGNHCFTEIKSRL